MTTPQVFSSLDQDGTRTRVGATRELKSDMKVMVEEESMSGQMLFTFHSL